MSKAGRLVIICGLPGSGKTTLARTFEDLLHGHRMDADTDMIEAGINLWGAEARCTRRTPSAHSVTRRLVRAHPGPRGRDPAGDTRPGRHLGRVVPASDR